MELKVCSKCGEEKSVKEFYISVDNRDNKSYYSSICKVCKSIYAKQYRQNNKERISNSAKQYYKKNKTIINEQSKKYYYNNKEWYSGRRKKYHEDNKEKENEMGLKYYWNNREVMRIKASKWRSDNPDKANAQSAKRRSRILHLTLSSVDKKMIEYMYRIAHEMTEERGIEYQVDHIKPLSKGGLHHEDNLQILSKDLNLRKASKWPLTKEEKLLYAGVTIKDLKNEGD
jgi:5-methylcytosine-specific restriction endonuclease McrA